MAATSLLARLGLRSALIGSAASLVYAAPIADGNVSNDAHTHAARTGWYHPTPTSMGFVANATEVLRLAQTEVTAYAKLVTAASTAAGPGFVLTPGVAPAAPANGDVWLTGVDAYARINGVSRTLGEETYVASVNSEATIQAAVAAAEASSYKNAVITITASITLTGGIGSTLTKNYTFIGTGSTGAGGGIRPTLTKGNGPWMNANGKNLSFVNLQVNANLPQNFITIGPNVNVQCFGCSFVYTGGGNFFYREYAGALTASFDNCTVAVTSGAFLWFGESNPADTNIPQGEILFTGCTLSGLMVKCDNAGKVNCTLVGSTLVDPGTGCWYATEFSAGRSNLAVNYNSRDTTSLALAAGSTDTITFTNRASAGGSATLASTQVGVGDGSNLLSGSASLTFNGSTFKVSPAVAGDGTINLEAGTGATTARAILFLRGNVGDSTTGWFFIRNGTTVGSHLDLVYTPSANINDAANKHSVRFFTDGAIQFGGTFGASPGAGRFVFNANTAQQPGVLVDASGNGGNYITVKNTSSGAAAAAGIFLEAHSPARGAGLFAYSSGHTGTLFGITLASKVALYLTNASSDGLLLGTAFAGAVSIGTSDVERIRVFADGGVQIGGAFGAGPGASNLSVSGVAYLSDGTAGTPSLTFTADTNTGLYRSNADEISFATNGVQRAIISATQLYTNSLAYFVSGMDLSRGTNAVTTWVGSINANWSGGPGASEGSSLLAKASLSTLTSDSTGAIGCAAIRTSVVTTANLVTARNITGLAGWYEKGDLGVALGVGGSIALTNYYGGYVANLPALAAGVTLTNQYGLYLEAPSRGSALNISLYAAGLVHFNAAENHAITRVSGNTTLDATHFSVEVDASGGPVTITLPDSTGAGVNGRIYNVKKIDNSGNAVTIQRSGADTIDGATTQSLTAQWQSRTVQARAATPGYAIF